MGRPPARGDGAMTQLLRELRGRVAALESRRSAPIGKGWRVEEDPASGDLVAVSPGRGARVVLATGAGEPGPAVVRVVGRAVGDGVAYDEDSGTIGAHVSQDAGNALTYGQDGGLYVATPPALPVDPPAPTFSFSGDSIYAEPPTYASFGVVESFHSDQGDLLSSETGSPSMTLAVGAGGHRFLDGDYGGEGYTSSGADFAVRPVSAGMAAYAVVEHLDTADGYRWLSVEGAGAAEYFGFQFSAPDQVLVQVNARHPGWTSSHYSQLTWTVPDPAALHIFEVHYAANGAMTLWADGALVTPDSSDFVGPEATLGAGALSFAWNAATAPGSLDVYEALFYNRALTDAERAAVRARLTGLYG